MLLLIFANGHMCCAIDQDVGGHQVRVDVESDRSIFAVLSGLFLELGHAIEPADTGDATEHPGKFGMLGDLALVKDDVFLRVDAARKERSGHLACGARQFARVLPYRDGVQVDHAIDAVITILQRDELGDRAEIITEMQVAGRLHAGKYAFLERHCSSSSTARGAMPRRGRAAQGLYVRTRSPATISLSFTTPSTCNAAA